MSRMEDVNGIDLNFDVKRLSTTSGGLDGSNEMQYTCLNCGWRAERTEQWFNDSHQMWGKQEFMESLVFHSDRCH